MDNPASEEPPRIFEEPNLLWTPRIEGEIEAWQRTGVFPFPEMDLHSSQHFRGLSPIELRLIHHLSSMYRDMRLADFVQCTLWVQQIPRYARMYIQAFARLAYILGPAFSMQLSGMILS